MRLTASASVRDADAGAGGDPELGVSVDGSATLAAAAEVAEFSGGGVGIAARGSALPGRAGACSARGGGAGGRRPWLQNP